MSKNEEKKSIIAVIIYMQCIHINNVAIFKKKFNAYN